MINNVIKRRTKAYRDELCIIVLDNGKVHYAPFYEEYENNQRYTELIIKHHIPYLAAFKIQQWYHKVRLDIKTDLCKKRVNVHYDEYCGGITLINKN